MLASYVSTNQRDWDRYVQSVLMAYRASPHESTGITPNKLMFGREVDLPIDVMCGLPREEHPDVSSYVSDLRKRLESAHELARIQLKKSACYQSRQYNLKAEKAKFGIGSAVMVRVGTKKVGLSPKLQPKWDGPYIITHGLSDVVVRIQRGPRHKPKVLHVNRLKPYHGEVDKTWLSPGLGDSASQQQDIGHRDHREEPVPLSQPNVEVCQDFQGGVPEPLSNQEEMEHLAHGDDAGTMASQDSVRSRRKRKPPDRFGEWCASIMQK